MASLNPLAAMFGKSPIKPIQEHMAVAFETAQQLQGFFLAVKDKDWATATTVQKAIGRSEREADKMKKKIRLQLPKSLFLPVPRSDLLELLTRQDNIANCAKDISGIMLGRKMIIPTAIEDKMLAFVESSIATSGQALKAINELDELLEAGFSGREVSLVENLIKELDQLEHQADKHERVIRASLFKIEKDLPPVDVMFLYRVIEAVGELADCAQKVGSRLQLLLAR